MPRAALVSLAALMTLALASGYAAGATLPAYISAAVADSARPDEDKQRDADRKPGETLAFAGVKPGEQVVELAAGGGYFTRLLSAAVGPKGKVTVIVSPPKPDAAPGAPVPGAAVKAIAADPHYANVQISVQRVAELSMPEKAQLVWTTQNYHDFHNIPDVDIATINKAVFAALKPGGTFFVLDHAAEAGSGARDTNTLHRIDKATVIKEVEAAGFRLKGESGILANKDDPHTAKVFDPAIRGHTDQFILKFTKP
jgi:predicted methyltransferase